MVYVHGIMARMAEGIAMIQGGSFSHVICHMPGASAVRLRWTGPAVEDA